MSEKQPWVFIFGGTGESLSKEEKQFAELHKQIVQSYEDLQKLNLEISQNEKLEKTEGNSARISELKEQKTNINNALYKLNAQYVNTYNSSLKFRSHELYLPPDDSLANCRVIMAQGVHAPFLSNKHRRMMAEKKYGSVIKQFIKDTYDFLTADSEEKRINKCLQKLKEANPLPDRIVLNGHSRGASSCIELARAIYLDPDLSKIKIDMNINDPVPGPLRHGKSKKVIPPNVESLIITYAGEEKSRLFKPQNIHKIFYDKSKTAVTAVVLPIKHNSGDREKIKRINKAFWDNVILREKTTTLPFHFEEAGASNQIVSSIPKSSTPDVKYVDISPERAGRIQFRADDLSESIDANVRAFHQSLTSKERRIIPQHPVSPDENKNIPRSVEERKTELNRIYDTGRAALETKTPAFASAKLVK